MLRKPLLTVVMLASMASMASAQGTTGNILEYDGSDAFVLETSTGQWYARNDHSLYERYGVVEAVASLTATTAYEGKYARVGKTIYQYAEHRWNATNISVARSTIPADGVYIVDKGGQFVKPSLWASSHTATQASGIAVVTNGTGYVVAPKARSLPQTMTLAAASADLTLSASSSAALSDAGGKSNTRTLVSIFGNHATAASYCQEYGFEWGGRGFLPSAQEAKDVLANPAVTGALAMVDGWQNNEINALATSTMQTPTMVWCVEGASGSLAAHDVAEETVVVPVAFLPTVSFSYPYPDSPDTDAASSDGLIHFADPVAKQVCVELYDTDGDGELSYAEAAAVLSIDTDLSGKKMEMLDELVYFSSIKTIYAASFSNCTNLVSVTLPVNISSVWSGLFYNCSNLRYIHVDNGNHAFCSDDGVLLNRIRTMLYRCPQKYPGEYIMPSTVMYVQYSAFQGCTALTSVDISPECIYIDLDAFADCNALQSVRVHWQRPLVPSSDIFSGVNLSQLTLYVPKGTKSAYQAAAPWSSFGTIVEYEDPTANAIAFADDEVKAVCVAHWDTNGDRELSYAEAAAVTSLGNVFTDNEFITSFREFQYFTRVQTLSAGEFEGCRLLESILLPPPLRTIESSAFKGCEALGTLSLTSNVRSIATNAFDNTTSLTAINVSSSNNTYAAEDAALYDKSKTTLFKFPSACPYTSMKLPSTLISIEDGAFQGASGLVSVRLPLTLKTIGHRAFHGCTSLLSLTLPGLVNAIGEYAFAGCTGVPSVSIPEDVTAIPAGAFAGCSALTEVSVATPLTTIDANAFADTPIAALPVGETTTTIGDYAFARCPGITETILPPGLETIGSGAFTDCSQVAKAEVPATVTSIGSKAFHIPSLKQLTVRIAEPLEITQNTFANYDDCVLFVPLASLDAYTKAPVWQNFLDIRPLIMGDVNHDGLVNVLDVTLIIDYILGRIPKEFYFNEADVDGNNLINVIDVTRVIDIILQKE